MTQLQELEQILLCHQTDWAHGPYVCAPVLSTHGMPGEALNFYNSEDGDERLAIVLWDNGLVELDVRPDAYSFDYEEDWED